MHQNIFSPPHSVIIFLLFILFLASSVRSSDGDDERYTTCSSNFFQCGKLENISYPFWGNDRPYYCGQPKFKLDCDDGYNATIQMDSIKYRVIDIFPKSQILKIARWDFSSSLCPDKYLNTTLDLATFNYNYADENMMLFYNCERVSYSSVLLNEFSCLVNSIPQYAYYLSSTTSNSNDFGDEFVSACDVGVVVPVLKVAVDRLNNQSLELQEVLNEGFEVGWISVDETECLVCNSSGGKCGYNNRSSNTFTCFCVDGDHPRSCLEKLAPAIPRNNRSILPRLLIGIGVGIVGILSITITICCFGGKKISSNNFMVYWKQLWSQRETKILGYVTDWKRNRKNDQNVEDFIRQHGSLAPKRYSYEDIKKITYSFRDKIGQGGYGGVYKGKLFDGRLVAVKVLNESKGNGEEFINEVSSISRTSHVNVVTLLGFCFEGQKRGLIYEFMPNGSLEKFIYDDHPSILDKRHLGWEKLYQILIGIARGLEYLHRGCNTRILHFDIKPHNILLDEDFCPKIADFGLAKLCLRKESIVSMLGARGTIGYIAPEVFCRNFGGVSHKSDVYSYGMMILEMVGGRKNINVGVSQSSSEVYFPNWIYKRLELENDFILEGVTTEAENEAVRKMILVGLWCIQTDPSHRPSMSKVMDMLQGSIAALQIPPKPFLSSPPRSPPNSSTISTSSVL